jgi:hypothetical protein
MHFEFSKLISYVTVQKLTAGILEITKCVVCDVTQKL